MIKSRILIVDDEVINLKMVASVLAEDYEVLIAKDGTKALQLVDKQKPELILLDVMMPGMDGFEVARQLKANAQTSKIPLLFLTAKEDQQSIVDSFQVGGEDYIRKPFNQEELKARVSSHIRLHQLQNALNAELKTKEKNWQMIDEHIAFVFTDRQGNVAFASQCFCEEFHYRLEEIVGKNMRFLRSKNTDEVFYHQLWEAVNSGKEFKGELQDNGAEGQENWYHVHLVPRYDEAEKWVGFTGFYKNINDQVRLKALSETDTLTGLANRKKLDEVLLKEAAKNQRYKMTFSIIILDLDHFKSVNDTHGHQVGDLVLQQMAKILFSSIRQTDTVGRWGGEEFLILCPNTDLEGAALLAEHLKDCIVQTAFPVIKKQTCSFGVAECCYQGRVETLFKCADAALYQAKEKGRNRVEMATIECCR